MAFRTGSRAPRSQDGHRRKYLKNLILFFVFDECECFNCISHSCDIVAGDLEGDIESLDSSDHDICMAQGGRERHLEIKKEQQLARQLGTGFPGIRGRDYITPKVSQCIYVYMYICVYVYMCICVYVYMCICVYVYMCICVYV